MEKLFTISIFTENQVGVLARVAAVFTRRHLNIESITVSESEVEGVSRFTILSKMNVDQVKKVVKQLEKQVEVLKAVYHRDEETVYQEIALYKVPIHSIHNGMPVEEVIRKNQARILSMEKDFIILEKAGYKSEIKQLFDQLKPFGLLEFVCSGRVAVTKPMKPFAEYLKEMELAQVAVGSLQ
ncbi:MAG: acetolactate synthase small subunit [Bacteroidota bacterium]